MKKVKGTFQILGKLLEKVYKEQLGDVLEELSEELSGGILWKIFCRNCEKLAELQQEFIEKVLEEFQKETLHGISEDFSRIPFGTSGRKLVEQTGKIFGNIFTDFAWKIFWKYFHRFCIRTSK